MCMRNKLLLLLFGCWTFVAQAQRVFSLDEAITYAIENNPQIKSKKLDIQDADAQIKEFRSIGIPKVNGNINYSYYLAVPAQPVADFLSPSIYNVLFDENVIPRRDLGQPEIFQFTLFQPHNLIGLIEASTLLFDGTYIYGLKAAKLYRQLAQEQFEVSENDLKANVTKAYMATLIAQENLRVLDKNIQNLESSLREMKAMFDTGFAEGLDVDRLSLSLDNLLVERSNVRQLIDISFNVLKFQMGYPAAQEISLSTQLSDELIEAQAISVSEIVDDEVKGRPEYRLLESTDRLYELDIKRLKAGYLPSVRAFANVQQALYRQNLFDNSQAGWIPSSAVGLAISIPIYDGGEKSAKIQRAKISAEKNQLAKTNFEQAATLELRNAMLKLKTSSNTLVLRERGQRLSQDIFNKTKVKFEEGVGSSVEMTQAEQNLYSAQAAYINALYDFVLAKVELEQSLGKL